jgi:glucuronokinase
MSELAGLARAARAALLAGDRARFDAAVDGSFDVRRRIVSLDPRHAEMVECARSLQAGANFTGSGGAIVAVCRDHKHRDGVTIGLAQIGCETRAIEGD